MVTARHLQTRAAEERDAESIARLMAELGYPMTPEQVRDRLALVATSRDDELVVAEMDGMVVGFIAFRDQEFIERAERYGLIMAMGVAEPYKRQGIGSHLVQYFEQRMRDQGVRHLRLTSALHRENEAHRFYEARGYQVTGLRFTKELDDS